MEIKKYRCDICKHANVPDDSNGRDVRLQVVFTTEQTEGRPVKPYLHIAKVDICPDCLARILAGETLFGHGAQGWNDYYFKTAANKALIDSLTSAHENFKLYTMVVKKGVDMPRLVMEPSLETAWKCVREALAQVTGNPVKEE